MDFIIGLPKIQSNFDNSMAVVDRLTKIAHSILMITTITAYGVAKLFKTYIFLDNMDFHVKLLMIEIANL